MKSFEGSESSWIESSGTQIDYWRLPFIAFNVQLFEEEKKNEETIHIHSIVSISYLHNNECVHP